MAVETDDVCFAIATGTIETKKSAQGIRNDGVILGFDLIRRLGNLLGSGRSLGRTKNGNVSA